jgi:perosamine synthetase
MSWKKFKIPIAKPIVTSEDIDLVIEALSGGNLSSGEYVEMFEKEFAQYVGCRYAVAVNSGTAALEVALKALGIEPGDEVIVPSFTIAATANVVVLLGAKPVFAEVEAETYNLDPKSVKQSITNKTRGIMPIHYAGQCAEMDEINEIAKDNSLFVVEDAAPAAGALYKGRKAGTLGYAAGFSFFPDKNMTTGEGGMLTTDDKDVAERARYLRKHGAPTRYYNVDIGWNYKMPDFCAALGLSQLRRLEEVIQRKNQLAKIYEEKLGQIPEITTPMVKKYNRHTFTLYAIRVTSNRIRENIRIHLESRGIETRINFPPVHLQPIYQSIFGFKRGFLPRTEEISDTIISLPIFPSMSEAESDLIVESIKNAMK